MPDLDIISDASKSVSSAVDAAQATAQSQLAQAFKNGVYTSTTVKDASTSNLLSKLAPTILTTGAKDQLITKDVYTLDGESVLNSPIGKLKGFSTDFMEDVRQHSSGILDSVAGMVKVGAGGDISLDKDSLTKRASLFLGVPLSNLNRSIADKLVKNSGMDPNLFRSIVGTVDGVATTITAGGLDNTRGIFNLINRVTGDSDIAQLLDVGAEASVLHGIVSEAIRLGLPSAVDTVIQKSKNAKAAQAALLNNVSGALYASDLDTLNLMLSKIGVGGILAKVPDAAERLLQSYRFPAGTTPSQYPTLYTTLTGILDQLKPGWGTYTRNGNTVGDLTLFARASQDAITLFKTQTVYKEAATIASTFLPVSLPKLGKTLYPYALY